jgi:hypothetical protein
MNNKGKKSEKVNRKTPMLSRDISRVHNRYITAQIHENIIVKMTIYNQ